MQIRVEIRQSLFVHRVISRVFEISSEIVDARLDTVAIHLATLVTLFHVDMERINANPGRDKAVAICLLKVHYA
jgi:hypothetical protein